MSGGPAQCTRHALHVAARALPGLDAAAGLIHPDRGRVDPGIRRGDRAARGQPAPPLPDFRAGTASSSSAGGQALPLGPRRPAQLLARRLVSAGAFVPRQRPAPLAPTTSRSWCRCATGRPSSTGYSTHSEGLACIVVDDASVDAGATKEIAERHGARFVGLATNVGPAGARNAGLAVVHTAAGRVRGLRLRAGCRVARTVAGPLRRPAGGSGGTAHRASRTPLPATRPRVRRSTGATGRDPCGPGAASPSYPVRRYWSEPTWRSGPTSSMLTLRGGEDVDLVWRLAEAGWDVRYVPSSTVAHDGPPTLRAFLARRAFYGTTAAPLARRHGSAVAPVHLSGWSLAVWSLLLARRPVLALAALAAFRRHPGPPPTRAGPRPSRRGGAHRGRWHRHAQHCRPWLADAGLVTRPRAGAGLPADPRPVGAGAAGPGTERLRRRPPGPRPGARRAVHVADDVAYGAGVWVGCARERTLVPLVPRVSWRSRVWSSPTLHKELAAGGGGAGEGGGRGGGKELSRPPWQRDPIGQAGFPWRFW